MLAASLAATLIAFIICGFWTTTFMVAFALSIVPGAMLVRHFLAPERRHRKLIERGRSDLKDASGRVVARGVVRPYEALLKAPYTNRQCVAYWACFTGSGPDEDPEKAGWSYGEQRARVIDFVIEIDGERVLVEAQHATLLKDPRAGEGLPFRVEAGKMVSHFEPMTRQLQRMARHQEILLCDGDEVTVAGTLEDRGGTVTPFRDSHPTKRLAGTIRIAMPAISRDERVLLERRPYLLPSSEYREGPRTDQTKNVR
jgi:hypothetical protein